MQSTTESTFLQRQGSLLRHDLSEHSKTDGNGVTSKADLFNSNSNLNQTSSVFRELVSNPLTQGNVKSSMDIHLEDIISNCSLRGKSSKLKFSQLIFVSVCRFLQNQRGLPKKCILQYHRRASLGQRHGACLELLDLQQAESFQCGQK